MRRLFWAALGATVGVLIVRKLTSAARSLTPRGVAGSFSESLSDIGASFQDFVADVREAMTQRERDLLAALAEDGTELGAQPPVRPRSR